MNDGVSRLPRESGANDDNFLDGLRGWLRGVRTRGVSAQAFGKARRLQARSCANDVARIFAVDRDVQPARGAEACLSLFLCASR